MWFLPSSVWNYDRLLLRFCYYLSIRIVHLAFNPVSRTLSAVWLVYYMLRSPKHLSQLLFCHVSNKLFKINWEICLTVLTPCEIWKSLSIHSIHLTPFVSIMFYYGILFLQSAKWKKSYHTYLQWHVYKHIIIGNDT